MIKEILEKNEEVSINKTLVNALKNVVPSCFEQDGRFDIMKLESLLKSVDVDTLKEGYELNFLGKSYARLQTALETETVIIPDIEHNNKDENKDSKNVYMVGDNIDAIKHLIKSYNKKVKCIYIDPPYNTGNNDFIYPDTFKYNVQELAERADITIEEASRILKLAGESTHSAWLTFMFPRLFLARDLLAEDGVIFISIDDNEQANLKLLCDEIFGEENFLAQVIVQSNKRGQTYKQLAKTHEYLLIYTQNADVIINQLEKEIGAFELKDDISEFSIRELRNRNPKYGRFNRPNLYYPIYVNPEKSDNDGFFAVSIEPKEGYTVEVYPFNSEGKESCWRWGQPKAIDNIGEHTMISNLVGKLKNTGEYGIYEKYRKNTYKAKTIWFNEIFDDDILNPDGDVWQETQVITEQGSKLLKELGLEEAFDFPKPVYLIEKVLELGSNKDSIILDFFSGSATTAHAVMKLNSRDNGTRRYIAVQYPEDLDKKYEAASDTAKPKIKATIDFLEGLQKPHKLSEVGIERIKRAAKQLQDENNVEIDYGFKIYTLETPRQDTLDKIMEFTPNLLNDTTILEELGRETILATWKLTDGYGFNEMVTEINLGEYTGYQCKNTCYLIDNGISNENIKNLIEKIETKELLISRIVIFAYSFNITQLESLDKNIKYLKNNSSIKVIRRY